MKLRVIEVQTKGLSMEDRGKAVTHYIPQYLDERRGWSECCLNENLCAQYYYRQEDAVKVCMEYARKYEPKVVWSEDTEGVAGNLWHNCHDIQPPHDGRVLLAKIEAMPKVWYKATEERPDTRKDVKLLGWFDTGSTAYDFDIVKYRVRDGKFCDRNGHPLMTDKLWWRTLEKPVKED